MKHAVRMLIGCMLPLLLLFILPLFGISGGLTLLVGLVALFAGHLWMMRGGHGGCGRDHQQAGAKGRPSSGIDQAAAEREGTSHEHH